MVLGHQVIEVCGSNEAIGFMSMVDGAPRSSTARVKEDCEISVIDQRRFRFMVDEIANFSLYIMGAMARRIRGMGQAIANLHREQTKVRDLRERLVAGVTAVVPDAVVLGPTEPADRLPGIASIAFPGCSAESLLLLLDAAGIDCATGSACSAGVAQPSHVLLAMGLDETTARSVLRFSLAGSNTVDDLLTLRQALPDAVDRARAAAAYA